MGWIVECGACGGSGVRRRPPPEEPDLPDPRDALPTSGGGTGALDSAAAFQRHLDAILGDREPVTEPRPDASALSDLQVAMACSAIDGRFMDELPDTLLGRTTRQTVRNLERIVADYRALAPEIHRAGYVDRDDLDRKIADATRSLETARENLRPLLNLDRDVDAELATLHARVDSATAALDVAEVQIDLAELHMSRNDDFEAEEHLRKAETGLEPFMDRASGAATADALVRSLSQVIGSAGGDPAGMGIEETMRVRTLLGRLYRGLARVAPDQASHYHDRLTQLEGSIAEGSRDNADFSNRMLSSLDDLFDQLDRREGPP